MQTTPSPPKYRQPISQKNRLDIVERYNNHDLTEWQEDRIECRMMITLGTPDQEKWMHKYISMLMLQIKKKTCLKTLDELSRSW